MFAPSLKLPTTNELYKVYTNLVINNTYINIQENKRSKINGSTIFHYDSRIYIYVL